MGFSNICLPPRHNEASIELIEDLKVKTCGQDEITEKQKANINALQQQSQE